MASDGIRVPLKERFESKYMAVPESGCWLWTAYCDRDGYGRINSGGRRGKLVFAHRVSYELHIGPIPEGLYCLHRCDVPGCVNPQHLFLGTQDENAADMARKGGAHSPFGHKRTRGEDNGHAKLTEEKVRQIRRLYGAGGITQAQLCRDFSIGRTQMSYIVNRKTWRHI